MSSYWGISVCMVLLRVKLLGNYSLQGFALCQAIGEFQLAVYCFAPSYWGGSCLCKALCRVLLCKQSKRTSVHMTAAPWCCRCIVLKRCDLTACVYFRFTSEQHIPIIVSAATDSGDAVALAFLAHNYHLLGNCSSSRVLFILLDLSGTINYRDTQQGLAETARSHGTIPQVPARKTRPVSIGGFSAAPATEEQILPGELPQPSYVTAL